MSTAFQFPPSLDVRNVAEVARALAGHDSFDASQLTACDSAGAQLLVAARRASSGRWILSPALREQLTAQGIPLSLFEVKDT